MKTKEAPKKSLFSCERSPDSFLELHPLELSRQLALIEFSLIRKITPVELMNQVCCLLLLFLLSLVYSSS